MIRSIILTIAMLSCVYTLVAQNTNISSQSSINQFDEKLFLHVLSESNHASRNLLEYRDHKNQVTLAENLTAYAYSKDLESSVLSRLENSQLLLDLIKKDIENENYAGALAAINNVSASDFDKNFQDDYQFYKAYLLFVHKEFDQAKGIFDKAASLKGEFKASATYYSAFCELFQSNFDKAKSKFTSIKNQSLYRDEVPFYLGLIHYKQENYKDAIALLSKHSKRNSSINTDNMRDLLTRSYYKAGKWGELTKILLADNQCCNSPEDHYFVGLSLYKQGNYDLAKTHLSEASKLKSKEGQNALLALGDIYMNENIDQSLPYLIEASHLNYDLNLKDQAFMALASAYENKGDISNAAKYAQRIPKSSDYYNHAVKTEIRLNYDNGEYNKALKSLLSLDQLSGELELLYHDLLIKNAAISLKAQKTQKALQYLNEAAQLPYSITSQKRAQLTLGKIYFQKKQYDLALKNLNLYQKDIKDISPLPNDLLQSKYMTAYSHLNKENYKSALKDFNIAEKLVLDVYRSDASTQYEMQYEDILLRQADINFSLGHKKKAQRYYNNAYEQGGRYADYSLYQKGKIEDLNGEPYLQLATYEQLEKEYPSSKYILDSKLKRANVYLQLNKSKEAFDLYASIYKSPKASDNDIFQALMRLGLISYNQGDVQTALVYYKKIFEFKAISPEQSKEALLLVEEIYLTNLKDSESYFTFVDNLGQPGIAQHNRDSIDYHIAIGVLQSDKNIAEQKLVNYLTDYPSGKNRETALLELSKLYESENVIEKAIASYKDLYNLKGKHSQLALSKVIHLYSQEEDAIDQYILHNRFKIEENYSEESNSKAYANIAKASYKANKVITNEKAILLALQGNKLNTEEKDQIKYALALAYFQENQNAKGTSLLNQLTYSKNQFIANSANYRIAQQLYQSDQSEDAIKVLGVLMSQSEMNKTLLCKAINLRSAIHIDAGEFDIALAGLESVLEQSDIDVNVLKRTDELIKTISEKRKEMGELQNPTLELEYVYNEK